MRNEPSATAAWVAGWRTLGRKLPSGARLVDDPYGAEFAVSPRFRWLAQAPAVLTLPLWPLAAYMQVRTRTIDDVLRTFVAGGGRQLLILGAGYDCRAVRFAAELADGRVFEVDHPATAGRKQEVLARLGLPSAPVTRLAWDFEQRPVTELPAALAAEGHDPASPTMVIWEGVTMYLTETAIDATVRAVAGLSAPGSPFVVNYVERSSVERPTPVRRVIALAVARVGEPFRFGWDPEALPAWFSERGFTVSRDATIAELGRELLPARYADLARVHEQRIAILARAG